MRLNVRYNLQKRDLSQIIAEKTFEQLNEESLFWVPNDNSNSIAVIVKHMSGHMVSRWTDVLISDNFQCLVRPKFCRKLIG